MRKAVLIILSAVIVYQWGTTGILGVEKTFIVGVGLGEHEFSTVDDAREARIDERPFTMTQYYGTWFPWKRFGIGYRLIRLYTIRVVSTPVARDWHYFNIVSHLATFDWHPWNASDTVGEKNIGIVAGCGVSQYNIDRNIRQFEYTADQVPEEDEKKYSADGSIALGGGYFDWGSKSVGLRAGINIIQTNYDPIQIKTNGTEQKTDIDASGAHWYLDIRWKF